MSVYRTDSRPITGDTQPADRITTRDAFLLRLVAEHRMLTSTQIATAMFPRQRTALHRIGVLRALGLIETFRPPATGSSPLYCVATARAVRLVAEAGHADRVPVAARAGRTDVATAVALRPDLNHLKGVNEVFCRLLGAARANLSSELEEWRSEWATARTFAAQVRPDGFGRWRDSAAWCEFFLEYDTGSESQHRLTGKLRGYADLATAAAVTCPVLFWVKSPERENNLHDNLATYSTRVPVATAFGDPAGSDPAGPIWRPSWASWSRLALAELGAGAAAYVGESQRPHNLRPLRDPK